MGLDGWFIFSLKGAAISSSTVSNGRVNSWGNHAVIRRICCMATLSRILPFIRIEPSSGKTKPATEARRVLLPCPEGP